MTPFQEQMEKEKAAALKLVTAIEEYLEQSFDHLSPEEHQQAREALNAKADRVHMIKTLAQQMRPQTSGEAAANFLGELQYIVNLLKPVATSPTLIGEESLEELNNEDADVEFRRVVDRVLSSAHDRARGGNA